MANKYTDEHINFLRNYVPGHTVKDVVEEWNKRFDLKINECILGNLKYKYRLKNGLVGGQFYKGQISHNKGKKWADFMSDEGQRNSSKTTFKKGNKPANSVPIGTERITKDGYIEVKVQDGCRQRNWRGKHQIIWEEANGKIPKGHTLIFLDRNPSNVSLDNLVLVSRSELVRLNQNHLIFEDKNLTQVGVNIAKLKNAISSRRNKK